MPSASELARQEAEQEQPTSDAETVLDGLQTRARRLGYTSIGEALDALEEQRNG